MDRPSLIAVVIPLMTPIALFTGLALPFIAARRPREPGGDDVASVGYLYVPCVRIRHRGSSAEIRRWVQAVPVVKTTAKWIYYTSDSWDRHEAVVSPGCISRQEFETDTRCHDVRCARHGYTWEHCRHGEDRCHHGYPAGVIPIPGHRHRPGPADRLFFATRQAAEDHLYRGERQQTGQAAPQGPPLKELRRAMADAHPDRGGTAEQFIQARRRYQTALGFAMVTHAQADER